MDAAKLAKLQQSVRIGRSLDFLLVLLECLFLRGRVFAVELTIGLGVEDGWTSYDKS